MRLAAMPAPMPGCISRKGAATVPMPTSSAGPSVGCRDHVEPQIAAAARRERDADQVVRDPADHALAAHGGRGGDAIVAEAPARHVPEPAADEAVVRWRECRAGACGRSPRGPSSAVAPAPMKRALPCVVHVESPLACLRVAETAQCHFKST